MDKFTNMLDNIEIASPCKANWNEMYGDDRKRHCSMCELNVYNLSEMTKQEAEKFLANAEGRTCVKFYRRADGTVLTQNCPVGWQAVKQKFSLTARVFASLCGGIFGGIFAFNQIQPNRNELPKASDFIKVSSTDSNTLPTKSIDFKAGSVSDNHLDSNYGEASVGQMIIKVKPHKSTESVKPKKFYKR